MPKLLVITTVPITLEGFLLPFAVHFRRLGWQVDALSGPGIASYKGCADAFEKLWSVAWSRNPINPRNFTGALPAIVRVLKSEGYDLVHVHTPVAALVTRLALLFVPPHLRPTLIYTAHGFHFYRGGNWLRNILFLAAEKIASPLTDHLVVINTEDEEAAIRHRLVPRERLWYMPGIGVSIKNDYNPASVSEAAVAQVRSELGLENGHQLVLMIAGFDPGKRHSDLLRAFAKASQGNAHLALAGQGPLLTETQKLARQLGIEERVHFLGFRRDIPALIRSSAAVVLPSEREGLPRSVMEAMSLGTPVIGTDIRGIRDLIGDGRGVLVPIGAIPSLAKAIEWLLNHPLEASKLAERAQRHVQKFDLHIVVSKHVELYDVALSQKKSPAQQASL